MRAAGEVQHELPDRDQLDGRARLQAEEPRGAGGRQGQGSLGEARGEYQARLFTEKKFPLVVSRLKLKLIFMI